MNLPLIELRAVGADGLATTFFYSLRIDGLSDPPEYCLHLWDDPDGPAKGHVFFELVAVELDQAYIRVKMMSHFGSPRYARKGLPEAAIVELNRITGKRLRSSVKFDLNDTTNRRSDDADKVWRRLVCNGLAIYHGSEDKAKDHYELLASKRSKESKCSTEQPTKGPGESKKSPTTLLGVLCLVFISSLGAGYGTGKARSPDYSNPFKAVSAVIAWVLERADVSRTHWNISGPLTQQGTVLLSLSEGQPEFLYGSEVFPRLVRMNVRPSERPERTIQCSKPSLDTMAGDTPDLRELNAIFSAGKLTSGRLPPLMRHTWATSTFIAKGSHSRRRRRCSSVRPLESPRARSRPANIGSPAMHVTGH